MRRSHLVALAGALGLALPASAARAQRSSTIEIRTRRDGSVECYRDDRRVDCESVRAERDRAEHRATDARRRADEIRQRERERANEIRERERERADRRRDEWRRQDEGRTRVVVAPRRRYDDLRPRVSLGGGADIRRFGDVNRYLGQIGVDFHTRFGLGLRPEVMYAWTDRQRELLPTRVCATCGSAGNAAPIELRSRSQMLGVSLNATYAFLRGSPIRPYLLGGIGVFSTREAVPVVATSTFVPGSQTTTQLAYRTETRDHADFGLNTGAGLEFGRGPVRLFTEFRYFLTDTATPRGFSGMLPITAGLRF